MFAESNQPHVLKGDVLELDFTMDMDHRKRRRNRTTQSCLNCHTSKRKCDRKRPCQRCIQLGLTGLCVYEVDDPALRDDPDIDETTRLRNRIAELESLVRELRGKPHPRWADPNYYEGDASDKWHTRSQKRNPANKQRRPHSPGPNGVGGEHTGISVKTEPVSEMQQQYYRLSPSPPPPNSAASATAPYGVGAVHAGQFGSSFDSAAAAAAACGGSPVTYSPSSPTGYASCGESGSSTSSGVNGAYHYPSLESHKSYARQHVAAADRAPRDVYRYEESCACLSNPGAGHSFISLARQLDGMSNYLQHLPEHSHGQRCGIFRRIQELKSILHGEEPKSTSPPFSAFDSHSDSLRSPVDSDLMTPLSIASSVPISAPATPHSLQSMHWGEAAHHNGGYNPYFSNVPPVTDVYSKAVGTYDVVT